MWLLLIVAVAMLWLIGRTQGGGNAQGGINDVASENPIGWGFPAGLPDAVAQVESGGRQYDANGNIITSSAGAIGIMQLEPATAAGLGVDPYNQAQNIAGGTEYLKQLYDRYNGDLGNTLAAYNWGPGNVDRALNSGSPFPHSVQNYIAKVLSLLGLGA